MARDRYFDLRFNVHVDVQVRTGKPTEEDVISLIQSELEAAVQQALEDADRPWDLGDGNVAESTDFHVTRDL